jgi:hypothetical protein
MWRLQGHVTGLAAAFSTTTFLIVRVIRRRSQYKGLTVNAPPSLTCTNAVRRSRRTSSLLSLFAIAGIHCVKIDQPGVYRRCKSQTSLTATTARPGVMIGGIRRCDLHNYHRGQSCASFLGCQATLAPQTFKRADITREQFARLSLPIHRPRTGSQSATCIKLTQGLARKAETFRTGARPQGLEESNNSQAGCFFPLLHPDRRCRRPMNIQNVRSWRLGLRLCLDLTKWL